MLTLFAIPKPFTGDAAVLQRNALESWIRLAPDVEVVLLGDDAGVADAAADAGVRHVPGIATNEYGTPLLDSAFAIARAASNRRLLAYVNADIMLLPDFVAALRRIRLESFLCAGRRWDVTLDEPVDFGPGYEQRLRALIEERGSLALADAIDYFVLEREGPLTELLPFAVGRPSWDLWMIYRARSLRIPVLDATRAITAIHQVHSHDHVPEGTGYLWSGPEANANLSMVPENQRFELMNATHVLTRWGPVPALTPNRLLWRARRRNVDGPVERVARVAAKALRKPPP